MASGSESQPTASASGSDTDMSEEIAKIRASFPSRCRIACDVGQYKTVITLQPENLDATVKFHLTAAYPSVVPDIKVRSESLSKEDIQQVEEHLKNSSKGMIGKEMIQSLMKEAKDTLKGLGIRPGKVRNVHTETFIDEKSKKKKNKKKQKKSKSEEEDEGDKKLPSMKTAEDVVNRIIWDDNLETDDFLVGYIDRFRGLMEKYFTAFSWEDIATVDYDVLAIPKHRIQYFKYKDVKVWDKTKRMDNVFGSANGTKTIDVVMKEVKEKEIEQKQNPAANASSKNSSDDSYDDSDDESDDDFITVTIDSCVNIGTSSNPNQDVYDEEKEGRSQNDHWTDKLRPNYFLCVRITNQNIIDNICNVQDSLLQRDPLLAECCIPGASLHITINTLGLDTSEQLLHCMETLKKLKPELERCVPKSMLQAKGVSNFYSRVVYAKVHYEKDFLDFCDFLKLSLREAGVQIRDGYEFVPHITIAKVTRPVARARGNKDINPDLYRRFVDTDFGVQKLDGLYLCSMGDQRRADGFYLTPLEIHFDE